MYGSYYQPTQMYGLQGQRQDLIRVNGIDGARAYRINSPNSTVPLFDSNQDIMYIVSTDGACFPTIRRFRFEEIRDTATQGDGGSGYDKILSAIDELKEMIGNNGKQSVSE